MDEARRGEARDARKRPARAKERELPRVHVGRQFGERAEKFLGGTGIVADAQRDGRHHDGPRGKLPCALHVVDLSREILDERQIVVRVNLRIVRVTDGGSRVGLRTIPVDLGEEVTCAGGEEDVGRELLQRGPHMLHGALAHGVLGLVQNNPEQDAGLDALALRDERGEFTVRVRAKRQGHVQSATERRRLSVRLFELLWIFGIAQTHVHAEVCKLERLQPLNLALVQRTPMARDAESDGRQREDRRGRDGKLRRAPEIDGQDGADLAAEGEGDGLLDAVAGLHGRGLGSRLRRAIGLERGVAPVALIFHLEGVAGHFKPRGDAGVDHIVGDGTDVEERLMRRDVRRESPLLRRAVGVFDRTRFAGTFRNGMQDADADAIALEVGLGHAVEAIFHATRCVAGDESLPGVINVAAPADGVEGDAKGISLHLRLEILQSRADGGPVLVPHRGVDGAHDLVIAQAQVAEERRVRLEVHRERPGLEGNGWRGRMARSNKCLRQHGGMFRRSAGSGQ